MSTLRVDNLQTTDDSFSVAVEDIVTQVNLDAVSASVTQLKSDLGSVTDVAKGAALVGFKNPASPVGRTLSARLSDSVNVKDFGATGNGTTDDYAAIQAAKVFAGTTRTLYFPDGVYLITQPLVYTTSPYIKGEGHTSVILASGAFEVIRFDSTSVDIFNGFITDIRLASAVNTIGSAGIRIIGAASTFVAKHSWSNIRFSGFYSGIKVEKGHFLTGGVSVSLFSVNTISNCVFDEWNANSTQYGLLADGVNTLTITGGLMRAMISGIKVGDGATGFGDILVSGVHFNFGTRPVDLQASTSADIYGHNISLTGNQFDGLNTLNVYARNLKLFRVIGNNYNGSVNNDIQNCPGASVDFQQIECRYGNHKSGIGIAATTDMFKMSAGTLNAGTFTSAYVEVSVHATIAGLGQITRTQGYNLLWSAGTLTIPAVKFAYADEAGGALTGITVTNVSGEAIFAFTHNSTIAGTDLYVNVRVLSSASSFTPL